MCWDTHLVSAALRKIRWGVWEAVSWVAAWMAWSCHSWNLAVEKVGSLLLGMACCPPLRIPSEGGDSWPRGACAMKGL